MTATASTTQALEKLAAPPEQKTVQDLLIRMQPEIERAAPRTIGAERFTRLVLTELRRNPVLFECKPESLLGAMMLCVQLGLEPGPLGHAYLVPYKRECTFILGYRGMIELASRSGRLASIDAETVYEGDEFSYRKGTRAYLDHVPCEPADRGKERCWYAVAKLASPSGSVYKVLYPADVEAARKRSIMGRDGKGPWSTDYNAMALKTAIRRLFPQLPATVHMARAFAVDEQPVIELEADGSVTVEAPSAPEGSGE